MDTDLSGGLSDELEYVFDAQPDDPGMHESVNAWIWDEDLKVGLPRIGVEATGAQWETHDIQVNVSFPDGRVFNIYGPHPIHDVAGADGRPRILGAGPLSLELVEAFGHLRLRVDGEAIPNTVDAQIGGAMQGSGSPVPMHLEVDLHPAVPPFMNGGLLEEALWLLENTDEGGLMGHPWRFEQLCRASGILKLDGEEYAINGGANRIRRQGVRRLGTLRGHSWQACVFPSGRAFGYIAYPPRTDGHGTYNEGYLFEGSGPLIPARITKAPWLTDLTPSGQDVTCVIEPVRGSTVTIRGETAISTFMVMPPEVGGGGLHLQQAICRYAWDGEQSVGMLERSTTLRG